MTQPGQPPRVRLAALAAGEDDALDPALAGLLLAVLARPRRSVEPQLQHLDRLAAEAAASGLPPAAALAEVLGRRHGFAPDDDFDPHDQPGGLTLAALLGERRGTPEALALLWLAVARRAGWGAEMLAFPVHPLVRLDEDGGRRTIVDPFAGGAPVDPPAMRAMLKAVAGAAAELEPAFTQPMPNREVVVRAENAAKLRLLRAGRVEMALATVEGILLLVPDHAPFWREAGMMHMRLDNLGSAVAALEQFVARTANAQARMRTQALLAELKGRM